MRGGARPGQAPPCDNRNHYRANAPVSHCPKCGGVVNGALQARSCREDEHATARRRQMIFCVHCGTRLMRAS
jgi:hypothetical protein